MKHWSPAVKAFLGIFILFELIGWIFVGSTERLDQLLLINGAHNAFADIAFQAITSIAEVVLPLLLLVYLFRFQINTLFRPERKQFPWDDTSHREY